MITVSDRPTRRVSMTDATDPLASFSKHAFELDGATWPSVEHYFQAMGFEDEALREEIRNAGHPAEARKRARKHRRKLRKDWDKLKTVYMTRAIYTKCRSQPEVAQALLATGDEHILETSLYDYFWGCGRDLRGHNHFGQALMGVRQRLRDEAHGD